MKKWIYISIMIASLCFGIFFILGKKQTVPTKVLSKSEEVYDDREEVMIMSEWNEPKNPLKTIYEYIKEILAFSTSITTLVLTVREIRRKKA